MIKQQITTILLGIIVLLLSFTGAQAQTCSCSGASVIGSQSIGTTQQNSLVVGLTYQYHDISKVYSGSDPVEDPTQTRSINALVFEINYGITERLALSGTINYLQKYRKTGINTDYQPETIATRGIGDGVVMAKYLLLQKQLWRPYRIVVGGGAKIPYGPTNLRENGLLMNADMQPSTGSLDAVAWTYLSRTLLAQGIDLFLTSQYRYTGSFERFNANDHYSFGNEFTAELGAAGPLIKQNLSYIFRAGYRNTATDQRNGVSISTTGGDWVYLKPALNYKILDTIDLRVSGYYPIYQHLNSIQPTTSYKVTSSILVQL